MVSTTYSTEYGALIVRTERCMRSGPRSKSGRGWERLEPVREMRSTIRNQGTTIHHSSCMGGMEKMGVVKCRKSRPL